MKYLKLVQTISNHLANKPETVGCLNGRLFSKMEPNATFINTGRGAQVDIAALKQAMKDEPNRTALLDVTDPEPVSAEDDIWEIPNIFPFSSSGRFHDKRSISDGRIHDEGI